MGAIKKQGVDSFDSLANGINFAQAVLDIIANPSVVTEACRQLTEAVSISDARRSELQQASQTILDSKEIGDRLQKEIKDHHDQQVADQIERDAAWKEINDQRTGVANERAEFEQEKAANQDLLLSQQNDLAASQQAVLKRERDVGIRENTATARETTLEKNEADYNGRVSAVIQRENAVTARETRIKSALDS